MSDYTPTEEVVRQTFAYVQAGLDHDEGYPFVMDVRLEEFDRFLASVRADALRGAAEDVAEIDGRQDDDAAEWLHRRADRIENGGKS